MENKKLAILGHLTRGNEVIEILEMLGGINQGFYKGDGQSCSYYIDDKNIKGSDYLESDEFIFFTLEEFLEKYSFKVGDKVIYKNLLALDAIYVVRKMLWENNQIKYIIHNQYCDKYNFVVFIATAEDLQLYKDEIYIDCPVNNNSKPGVTVNGEKLIAPKGYTIKTATMDGNNLTVEYVKKQPQYPKTYNECCNVLIINPKSNDAQGYKADDIICFQELLIARDAYWKIAGEEMGLFEPWEPNFGENFIYAIGASYGTIEKRMVTGGSGILLFPTEEMRDAFYENFKDLIESCKEFL